MTRWRSIGRGFARDTGGAAAVEFALVSVAFFAMLFGIMYMAVIVFTNASLQWAVSEASRLPEINPSVSQSEIANAINQKLSTTGITNASVTYSVSQSGTTKTGTIAASFDKTYTVPMIDTFNIHYSAQTTVPLGG